MALLCFCSTKLSPLHPPLMHDENTPEPAPWCSVPTLVKVMWLIPSFIFVPFILLCSPRPVSSSGKGLLCSASLFCLHLCHGFIWFMYIYFLLVCLYHFVSWGLHLVPSYSFLFMLPTSKLLSISPNIILSLSPIPIYCCCCWRLQLCVNKEVDKLPRGFVFTSHHPLAMRHVTLSLAMKWSFPIMGCGIIKELLTIE